MSTSLLQLRTELMARGGYGDNPPGGDLKRLRDLVNNMLFIRSIPLSEDCTKVDRSGSLCTGHTSKTSYDYPGLSLGDIKVFSDAHLKVCTCDADHKVGCECKSEIDCGCVNRTSCSCVNRTSCSCVSESCTCNTTWCPWNCDCESRTGEGNCSCNSDNCGCHNRTAGSDMMCEWDVTDCSCEMTYCTCQSRSASDPCTSYDAYPVDTCNYNCGCENRTACSGVSVTCSCNTQNGCQCNNRCSCNAVRTFQ